MPWGQGGAGGGAAATGWGASQTSAVYKPNLQCSICHNLLAFPACTPPFARRLVPRVMPY